MREKWAVVSQGYFGNAGYMLRLLDEKGWSANLANDLNQLGFFLERGPQAVCILSVMMLVDLVKDMGLVFRTCVENGVARVAVASIESGEVERIWKRMDVQETTKLKVFGQPEDEDGLIPILDFVTEGR